MNCVNSLTVREKNLCKALFLSIFYTLYNIYRRRNASHTHKKKLPASEETGNFATKMQVLELTSDFLLGITFNDIADFDVVEILDIQTAFHTCTNLLHIVLIALQ